MENNTVSWQSWDDKVLQGDGRPGTLGLWWSDFATAAQSDELAAKGITRRLNMAAEASTSAIFTMNQSFKTRQVGADHDK